MISNYLVLVYFTLLMLAIIWLMRSRVKVRMAEE